MLKGWINACTPAIASLRVHSKALNGFPLMELFSRVLFSFPEEEIERKENGQREGASIGEKFSTASAFTILTGVLNKCRDRERWRREAREEEEEAERA